MVTLLAPSLARGVTLAQSSGETTGASASIAVSLPSSSTAGDLLVVTLITYADCVTVTPPTGWSQAVADCSAGGSTGIWYRANAPATTTATFTTSQSATYEAQISDYSGAATSNALDQTGSATYSSATASPSVSTTGSTAQSGELAITVWDPYEFFGTLSPGSGWTALYEDNTRGAASDYKTGVAQGTVTESEGSGGEPSPWLIDIATFKPGPCSSGSLALEGPSTEGFGAVTLNARNQTATGSIVLTPGDETGTGSGWDLTATSTTLNNSGHTISTAATQLTSVSDSAASGNCSLPTNSITYPITLPAGTTAPAPVSIFNAAAGTGEGPTNVTFNFSLAVPANAYNGSYTSTWTLAINSGP